MTAAANLTRARLDVDLAALVGNWRIADLLAANAETAAVVKADAYGLGVARVVPALVAAGARTFFVAHVEEGLRVRAAAPNAVVYVLNGVPAGASGVFMETGLRPVIVSPEELREWSAAAGGRADAPPCAIHLDTGMNRAGLDWREAGAVAASLDDARVAVDLVLSHLACADEPDHALNEIQRARVASARKAFPGVTTSLANSGGILQGRAFDFDMVRPGIALYGGAPFMGKAEGAQTVARLIAPIIRVVDIAAGDSVSYGATFIAPRPSRIATVSVGYADGYPRALSNGGGLAVAADGTPVRVAGRVTMDFTMFDVTDVAPEAAVVGAPLELLGDAVRLDDLATAAGTIGYELIARLGVRFERRYTA